MPRRASWHLLDKVRILRSLRWGVHGFANLRHANMVRPTASAGVCGCTRPNLRLSAGRCALRCGTATTWALTGGGAATGCTPGTGRTTRGSGCAGTVTCTPARSPGRAGLCCRDTAASRVVQEPVEALHGNSEDELTDSWLVARNWEEAFLGQLGEVRHAAAAALHTRCMHHGQVPGTAGPAPRRMCYLCEPPGSLSAALQSSWLCN